MKTDITLALVAVLAIAAATWFVYGPGAQRAAYERNKHNHEWRWHHPEAARYFDKLTDYHDQWKKTPKRRP